MKDIFNRQIKTLKKKKPSENTRTTKYTIWKENSLDELIPNWRKQKKASVDLKTDQQEPSKPKNRKNPETKHCLKKKQTTKPEWPVRPHKVT